MLPVMVGFALWGVNVNLPGEAQYEYGDRPSTVTTFPEVVNLPSVRGSMMTTPNPPD